ncbi:hypothetical protein Bbelb_083240 [Branchiostoma belcheri]|nr:hypothetical protein Bbelb_083240 [Branchiostoma belcheri]
MPDIFPNFPRVYRRTGGGRVSGRSVQTTGEARRPHRDRAGLSHSTPGSSNSPAGLLLLKDSVLGGCRDAGCTVTALLPRLRIRPFACLGLLGGGVEAVPGRNVCHLPLLVSSSSLLLSLQTIYEVKTCVPLPKFFGDPDNTAANTVTFLCRTIPVPPSPLFYQDRHWLLSQHVAVAATCELV